MILRCLRLCLAIAWMTSLHADEFPLEPPKNFQLNPQYIALHHPVSTSQPLAQLYFDQGLTFIYAFNHDAAYWSFFRASQVDPAMPMAYWGMALALGSNINMTITPERAKIAYDTIQKALQLSVNRPQNEKDYIQALAQRYASDPHAPLQPLAVNYSNAMRELSNKYLDDADAATLFAESLLTVNPWNQWTLDGKPREGTWEAVDKLEYVLKRNPDHLGANHYYIHAIEASNFPERALLSANRLRKLLPSSGHILHMPSHIYILVGDYQQAAETNEEAIAADRAYMRQFGTYGIYPIHYLSHNYYFLSRARAMQGRFVEAKQAADELAALYLPHFHRMPELEYYAPTPLFVLLRFQRWNDILNVPQPNEEMQVSNVLWHFGRALAFASLGNQNQALQERQLFLEGRGKVPADLMYGYNKVSKILTIAGYVLESKLADSQGNLPQALDFMRKAVAEQDTLSYNEPPDWFFPLRESLGGLLLRMQQPAEAEQVFRVDLGHHPRNGRALFGLAESLRMQGKSHDLYWIQKEFEKAWMYSDSQLNIKNL